jgi:hypothetical protein
VGVEHVLPFPHAFCHLVQFVAQGFVRIVTRLGFVGAAILTIQAEQPGAAVDDREHTVDGVQIASARLGVEFYLHLVEPLDHKGRQFSGCVARQIVDTTRDDLMNPLLR